MSSISLHAAVVLGASAATILGGAWLSRYWNRARQGDAYTTELSGYVTVIGTLYAVLVAFVLLSVWNQYNTAQDAAEHESSQVADLLRLTRGLPEPAATQVKNSVREYATAVIDDEWQRMEAGGRSARADAALDDLWKLLVAFDPVGNRAVNIHSEALERLRGVSDSRQDRLSQAPPSVRGVIWVLLVGGGALTLIAASLFQTAGTVHLPVHAGLTLMIAFMLYLIFAFDHPFSRDVGAGPDALRAVIDMPKR